MSAKITRFPKRSKRHDALTEAAQLLLDMQMPLGLNDTTRDDLAEVIDRLKQPLQEKEKWSFVMLNPDQLRTVLKYINASEKPATTLRVWYAALSHIHFDDGEIMAGRDRLSEDTDTNPQEVSRALSELVKIGALTRIKRGRYAINPYVGWAGQGREAAAKDASPVKPAELRLVSD